MIRSAVVSLGIPLVFALTAVPAATIDVWRDPVFVQRFLGSFGTLAAVEPRIGAEEAELFKQLATEIGTNPEAAIARLERALTPASSAAVDFTLGNLLFQRGETERARRAYEAALRKHPDFRRAAKNLGFLHLQENRPDAALPLLARALELGDSDARVYGTIGYIRLGRGEFLAAETAYRHAAMIDPDTLDWALGLARATLGLRKFAEAEAIFADLVRRQPDRADYWQHRANALLGLERPLEAAHCLEIAHALGAASTDSLALLGDIYLRHELPGPGLTAYLEALDRADDPPRGAVVRAAQALQTLGDFEGSLRLVARLRTRAGTDLTPEDDRRLLALEAAAARAAGDAARALALLERIVVLAPLDAEAHLELARLHAAAGRVEKALFHYEDAARSDEHRFRARLEQGQLLVREARFAQALPALREAQALRPSSGLDDYVRRVERARVR